MLEKNVNIFKALGDSIRLRIMFLLKDGELCVCDLENALKMSQPRISQHLLKLKNAGLIKDRPCGKWKYYDLTANGKIFCKKNIIEILTELKNDKLIKNDLMKLKKYSDKKCKKI